MKSHTNSRRGRSKDAGTKMKKLRMHIQFVQKSEKSGIIKHKKKSKIKSPSPEFLILSERLKEAAKLKASGKYLDRDFDKLVDAL